MAVTTDFIEQKIQIRSNHGMVDGKEKITTRTLYNVIKSKVDLKIRSQTV